VIAVATSVFSSLTYFVLGISIPGTDDYTYTVRTTVVPAQAASASA
jgi:hypothetical protein